MRGFSQMFPSDFQNPEALMQRKIMMARLAWYQATLKEFEFCRLLRVPSSTPSQVLYKGKVVKL